MKTVVIDRVDRDTIIHRVSSDVDNYILTNTKIVQRYVDNRDIFEETLEGFSSLKYTSQLNLCKIYWLSYWKKIEETNDDPSKKRIMFPVEYMESCGVNRESFHRLNDKFKILKCVGEHYCQFKKLAKTYLPTENYKTITYLSKRGVFKSRVIVHVDVINLDTGEFETLIVDCLEDARTLIDLGVDVDYYHPVTCDFDRLSLLIDRTSSDVIAMQSTRVYVKYKSIDNEYYRKYNTCHRKFTMGGTSLQNVNKIIRNSALYGCWSYDIQNCHYTVFAHMTDHFAIMEYAESPEMVRAAISERTQVPPKVVKHALLAMAYGASFNGDLKDIVGSALIDDFKSDDLVRNLKNGIDQVKAQVTKGKEAKGQTVNQIFANYIMSIESKILDSIIAFVESEDNVVCCSLFDGLVTKKRVNVRVVEAAVKSATGYSVKITEEFIE